jgi:DNA-binding response OmpR family regulator
MPPQKPTTDLIGVRVLLLEDDALINMNTVELLEKMGCNAEGHLHLDEAWDAASRELPDVAVLDVSLHDTMTSLNLADWLHDQGVPIVFLTGYSSPTPSGKWQKHPKCEKPCDPEELKGLLQAALASGHDQIG